MKSYKSMAVLSTAILFAVLGSAGRGSAYTFITVKPSQKTDVQRPRQEWVLRSVLDAKPRILSIALNDKLWLAYNTKTASLCKAWIGKITFGGPVYTSSHGPQPISSGTTYMEEPDENPWRIQVDGKQLTPDVNYKGHKIVDNQVTLKYELAFQGKKITVEEKPEFFDAANGKAGFERVFTVANIPAGTELSLIVHLNSLSAPTDYKTDGKFSLDALNPDEVKS